MVSDFLKKYQEELISEKIQLKEDMDLLETKIKEESKFLSLLEESNDSYFKEFTPRDVNQKNNEKAQEVRAILNDLNSKMEEKNNKMKFFDARLLEIKNLLNNEVLSFKPSVDNKEDTGIDNNITNNDDIRNSLIAIKNTILLDPYRAKLDLEKLISTF